MISFRNVFKYHQYESGIIGCYNFKNMDLYIKNLSLTYSH